MNDSDTRSKGRMGVLASVSGIGFVVVRCAAGPLIVGTIVGVGLYVVIGGPGGALLVAGAVAAFVLVRRPRARGADACGPGGCRTPGTPARKVRDQEKVR